MYLVLQIYAKYTMRWCDQTVYEAYKVSLEYES